MVTITVKNIPEGLYERIKQSAEDNHRSINSEVIACLEQLLSSQPLDVEAFIQRARKLREKGLPYLYLMTDEDFNQAKGEGRA